MEHVAEIPLTVVGVGGAADLFAAHPEKAAALIATALKSHPLLPWGAAVADVISRRWLERQQNPYLDEIHRVASGLACSGVYFLNIVYEWACSTSAAPDPRGCGSAGMSSSRNSQAAMASSTTAHGQGLPAF
jgi:hypothetical protein